MDCTYSLNLIFGFFWLYSFRKRVHFPKKKKKKLVVDFLWFQVHNPLPPEIWPSFTFSLVIRVSIWLFFLIPLTQCMFSFVKEKVSCIAYRLKILLIWFRKHWENVIYHLKFVQSIYSLLKFVRKNSDSWVSTEGLANCSRTALSSISWLWISIFSVNRKDVVSLPNGVFAHVLFIWEKICRSYHVHNPVFEKGALYGSLSWDRLEWGSQSLCENK